MRGAARARRSRLERRRRAGLIAAAVLLAAAGGIAWYALWPTPAEIERRWIAGAGFDPLTAHPPRDANDAAARIDVLIAPLGLRISTDRPFWERSNEREHDRFRAVRGEVKDYLRALRRPAAELAAPPAEVAALLRRAEPILGAVAAIVAESEPPRWEVHLERGPDDPIPYWLDHLALHDLLLAAAAEAGHREDEGAARRWMEAAWRLRESLDEMPDLIEHLLALAELRDHLALLRATPGPLPEWERRLAPPQLRPRVLTAARFHGWHLVRALRRFSGEDFSLRDEVLPRALARLQARRGLAAVVAGADRTLDRLESAALRPSDAHALVAAERERMPRWNVIARAYYGYAIMPVEAWHKAVRAELELELTRQVIAIRELLRVGSAAAVEELTGERPSVVAGVSWVCAVEPRSVVLRAAGDVDALPKEGALPLEARVARR